MRAPPEKRGRRYTLAVAAASVALSTSCQAGAQVRWDVGLQAGATERITTGGGPSASQQPWPGPSAEMHAHLAVVPLLRVGPYVAFDLSPARGSMNRRIYAAGLRAKLTPPWLAAPWHVWAFLGVGSGYEQDPGRALGLLEIPVGVGIGRRVHGPWEMYAELCTRWDVLHFGSSDRGAAPWIGDDLLAVSLSVGVSLGQ